MEDEVHLLKEEVRRGRENEDNLMKVNGVFLGVYRF
jgi:hypothetical protein